MMIFVALTMTHNSSMVRGSPDPNFQMASREKQETKALMLKEKADQDRSWFIHDYQLLRIRTSHVHCGQIGGSPAMLAAPALRACKLNILEGATLVAHIDQ